MPPQNTRAHSEIITSGANPLVKRIRALDNRKYRRREGAFFFEGVQAVWRAVECGADIEVLVVAPQLLEGSAAEGLVAAQEAAGVRVARLSSDLFTRFSSKDSPGGLAAIARAQSNGLDAASVEVDDVFVVLHEVANPGNLGTIVRTADAAGAAGVILLGATADPYAPAAVKASMGSLFAVRVFHEREPNVFFDWAAQHDVTVFTTSARAETSHWRAHYRPPLAILFGSEGEGLPPTLLSRGHSSLRIPMVGTPSSLNLAVASGIVLFEAQRHVLDHLEGVSD